MPVTSDIFCWREVGVVHWLEARRRLHTIYQIWLNEEQRLAPKNITRLYVLSAVVYGRVVFHAVSKRNGAGRGISPLPPTVLKQIGEWLTLDFVFSLCMYT